MHFHTYKLEAGKGGLRLELAERASTDAAGISKCIGLQGGAKLDLKLILEMIQAKLSTATRLNIARPVQPAS